MSPLARIEQSLRSFQPPPVPAGERTRSAVAMLLREMSAGPELLFVERASHPGDPWSGDLGFPGGKLEAGDAGLRQAAERETREELGLDLTAARFFGCLGEILGAHLPVVVSCFVYQVAAELPLRPNHELQGVYWVPLKNLYAPQRRSRARVQFRGAELLRPAIRLPLPGRDILWGITYRLVMALAERVPELAAGEPPGSR
jgi:8-oxo-dGTP pyrophosphatase MutT (NUDIX family)